MEGKGRKGGRKGIRKWEKMKERKGKGEEREAGNGRGGTEQKLWEGRGDLTKPSGKLWRGVVLCVGREGKKERMEGKEGEVMRIKGEEKIKRER